MARLTVPKKEDDLMQNGADNPLARRCRRGRVRPGHLEIGAKVHEIFTLLFAENGLALLVEGFQLKCHRNTGSARPRSIRYQDREAQGPQ